MTGIALRTSDIEATHAELKEAGVDVDEITRHGDPVPPMFWFRDVDGNTLLLVLGALTVCVGAPLVEELFFRGFFYRSLRSRMGVLPAALIVGAVFGAIHWENPRTAVVLPVLGVLGAVFCLVYERTGTLFSTIGLHAINNAVAYGVETKEGWVASIVLVVLLSGCLIAARTIPSRVPRRRRPALAT